MKGTRTFVAALLIATTLSGFVANAGGVEDEKTRTLCRFGEVKVEGTSKATFRCKGRSYGQGIDLSAYGLDGELDYVHGMYYVAKIKSSILAKSADSDPNPVRTRKGEEAIIICYLNKKTTICRFKGGRSAIVPAKKLKVNYYLYNSTSAYKDAQIEAWVKQMRITSSTNYMFVVSKFNQHGWIMERRDGEWVCKYRLGVSTGAYTNGDRPNDIYGLNRLSINTHYTNKKGMGKGISYASKGGGNQIHVGQAYHPFTHGCIAMRRKDYNFVYWYLPYGTRVVSF